MDMGSYRELVHSMNNNIIVNNNFNLLRLIAAFQVMFVHANDYLVNKSDLSWYVTKILNFSGVTVFFLISGFLISMSYAKNQDLKTYIKNRILRIYPGLYVNIFIGIVILYVFVDLNFDFDFFKWLLTQISFLQFYNLEASRAFGTGEINAPLWTISIELVFYAVLPLIFLIDKKIKRILPCIFLISIIFFIYNSSSDRNLFINKLINVSLVPYLFVFLIGFYFYSYFDFFHKYLKDKFFIYFATYIIGRICYYYFNNIFLDILVNYFIFSFLVFSFAFSFKGLDNFLRGNDFTYGIYIYHMFFVNIFVQIGEGGSIYVVYVAILSMCCAIISWFFVEKPCLNLKSKSLYRSRMKNA